METKICSSCGQEKPILEFHIDKRRQHLLRHECKKCGNARNRKYSKLHPDRIRASQRKHRYGITEEEYLKRYKEQLGECLICRGYRPILDVDHDHESGKIRGLLCRPCNQALGLLRESLEILESAKQYLIKNN